MKPNRSFGGVLWWRLVSPLLILAAINAPAAQPTATYTVGSVLTNFTVYMRRAWTNDDGRVFSAGSPLSLQDLAGKIVFIEFFDSTCSTCQYAANLAETQIKRRYEGQKGTVNGLPFLHVAINIVPHSFLQPQTDDFISDYDLRVCADDFNSKAIRGPIQTNAVHDLFSAPFVKPIIVVINCVTNSLSHQPWSLLVSEAGGSVDWNAAVARWRTAIDSVEAPPPALSEIRRSGDMVEFSFPGQKGRTNQVQFTSDFVQWTVATNVSGTNAPIHFREVNATSAGARFYRIHRL